PLSSNGTLKSTRISTRLPLKLPRSARVFFGMTPSKRATTKDTKDTKKRNGRVQRELSGPNRLPHDSPFSSSYVFFVSFVSFVSFVVSLLHPSLPTRATRSAVRQL